MDYYLLRHYNILAFYDVGMMWFVFSYFIGAQKSMTELFQSSHKESIQGINTTYTVSNVMKIFNMFA